MFRLGFLSVGSHFDTNPPPVSSYLFSAQAITGNLLVSALLPSSMISIKGNFSVASVRFNREKNTACLHLLHRLRPTTVEPRLIMSMDSDCVPGNGTETCSASGSPAGLAVGLTLFFLILMIITGVIFYKYQSKIRTLVQFGQRQSQDKEDHSGTPHVDASQHTSMIIEESTGQMPIYENLASSCKRPAAKQTRSPDQSEEDLYLQCDPIDDGIYMNGPGYNSSIPACQEDDLYVMPESEDTFVKG
ncbi:uncharacterized protein LOC121644738 [Melanotaenia boesemani]|uniref:uncharacterized protein LOC121644738 n=1 Tax=Melanotaenia boesemani TaxID=1250792 RepID=UPI001C057267|nr:uncharacterized protein LOC121644738 [Melanotaenia boesemani]